MPARSDLDPEIEAVVSAFEDRAIPEWHTLSIDAARRIEDEAFAPSDPPAIDLVRDPAIPGSGSDLAGGRGGSDYGSNGDGDAAADSGGGGGIPIRVYRPDTDGPAPVLLFFHGGGWVLGTLDSVDGVCRHLADRTEAIVVSVDYRRAPEHPFPAALDDCWRALGWVSENARVFGGDPTAVSVGGTSAGANLAAATAIRSRAFDGPDIARQLLAYPITNHAFDTDSYCENAEGPLLTRADMEWSWAQYLRSPVDGYNPFASPLRAPESLLYGVAPATVLTAGFDPLRDEGRAYAERLDEADVSVTHHHYPRLCHGFLSFVEEVGHADRAMDDAARALRPSV